MQRRQWAKPKRTWEIRRRKRKETEWHSVCVCVWVSVCECWDTECLLEWINRASNAYTCRCLKSKRIAPVSYNDSNNTNNIDTIRTIIIRNGSQRPTQILFVCIFLVIIFYVWLNLTMKSLASSKQNISPATIYSTNIDSSIAHCSSNAPSSIAAEARHTQKQTKDAF